MRKRIAAFIGLLSLMALAVGFAAVGTGAYFSDTKSGTITSNTGKVSIDYQGAQTLNLSFADLMPGEQGVHKTTTFVNSGPKPIKVYLRTHAAAVPQGVSAGQAQKLGVYIDGSEFSGLSANPGSSAAVDTGLHLVQPGGTFTVNASAALSADASNEWQSKAASVSVDVIAQQPEAPAPGV
jgi:hypothetical protein